MNKAQVYSTRVLKFLAIAIVALPVLLFVFVSPSLAAAGINKTINFQGKVVNKTAGTNVANNTYTMIFSIYDKPSGGTQLWTETDSVTVTDGIFRVVLGAGTAFPANMNWNQNGLFLDITFNSEQMGSRVQLTAVPYAFNAGQVDGLTVQDSTTGASSTSAILKLGDATTQKTFDLGTNNLAFTTSGTTTLTLPTAGTLAILGANTFTGTQTFSGIATDITTGTGEDLTLAPNGSGKVNFYSSSNYIDPSGNLALVGHLGLGASGAPTSTEVINLTETMSPGSVTNRGIYDQVTANAAFTGSLKGATLRAIATNPTGNVADITGAQLHALANQPSPGIVDQATGLYANVEESGTGTLTIARSVRAMIVPTSGAITTATGLQVDTPAGAGTIGTMYGIWTQAQSYASTNYGARIDAASTQTLWLSGDADNTTANAGIAFGSSKDTNLYRAGANLLKTDDSASISGTLTIGQGQTIRPEYGPLTLSYKSGANAWSAGLTIQDTTGNIGIGTAPSTIEKLKVVESKTDTSGFVEMDFHQLDANPAGASSATFIGLRTLARTTSGNAQSFTGSLVGLYNQTQHRGTNTLAVAYGVQGIVGTDNTGTITDAEAFRAAGQSTTAAGNTVTYTGFYASNPSAAGGSTFGTAYGLRIEPFTTGGTADYGARIDAATTQTLWLSGNADNTVASAGIAFGQSKDTNLYRGGVNILRSDSNFSIAGAATVSAGLTLTSGGISLGGSVSDSSHCIVGGATAAWGACGGGGGTNYWNLVSGTNGGYVSPINGTTDFLLGFGANAPATSSAKFAVLNVTGSGNPTASVSAQNAGNNAIYLDSTGYLQTARNQSLTIGGATTGNITISPNNGGAGSALSLNSQKIGFFGTAPVAQQTGSLITALSNLGLVTSGTISQSEVTGLTTASSPSFAGETLTGDLTISAHNIVTDTTTGTKIGTATNQKIGFYNTTPVVQPTGANADILTALGTGANGLGLIASPTIAQADVTGLTTGSSPSFTALTLTAGTGTVLTINGAATTGISFTNTSLATDISLQNSETIDNHVNGSITFTNNTANTDTIRFNPGANGGSGRFNGIVTTADLSADKTWTFPNVSGNVITSGDSGTVTNTMLASSAITLNAGASVGLTTPGAMSLGSTYTIGATTDKLQFGALGLGVATPANAGQISAVGGANNITLFTLKRNTDTAPTGNFVDFQNAASGSLFTIDITGKITAGTWNGGVIDSTYGGTGINNAGRTLTINTNSGTLAFSGASKTLTVGDSATINTNSIVLAGETLTLTSGHSFTLDATNGNTYTFPSVTAGTVLTTNQTSQTINSGQTSGTILALNAGTPALAGGLTGQSITLNGTNAQAQTGLTFAVTGTGTLKDVLGTSSTWQVTSAGAATFTSISNGGNLAFTGTSPSITNTGTNTLTLNSGSTGDLQFFGTSYKITSGGALTVASCSGCGGGGGTNYWNLVGGAGAGYLSPINGTTDLLLGFGANSPATSAAKFSFLNAVGAGNPTASVSAQNAGGQAVYLDSTGFVQSTRFNTLTLGGATTGNVIIAPWNGAANSTLSIQASNTFLGIAGSMNGKISFYSSAGGITPPTINTDSSGNLNLSATQAGASVVVGSGVGDIVIDPGTYKIGVGISSSIISQLHVTRALSNGATGKALAIFDQIENQDIFTASKGGVTKFVVDQNGNMTLAGTTITSGSLTSMTTSSSFTFAAAAATVNLGASGGTLNLGNGGDYTISTTSNGNLNFATGGTGKVGLNAATPLANFDIRSDVGAGATSGTVATASVSGATSFAGLVVNNSGVGDILTASKAGATKFRITNRGSVLFQGDTLTSIGSLINEGAAASQVNQSAVVNAIGDQGSIVPNAGFESAIVANKTSNIADQNLVDGWVAAATNSAVITRVATESAKGSASLMIKLNASQNTAVYSVCLPLATSIASGYNINMYAKASQVVGVMIRGYLDTYVSQANCQNDTSRTTTTATPVGTATTTSYAVVPNVASAFAAIANNKWSRVHIFIGCASNCTAATIINIDGIRLIENTSTNGVDYAENYQGDSNNLAQPGDVVSLSQVDGKTVVVPSTKYQDKATIGVVSTNPGYVLDDGKTQDPEVAVALAGRIPVKVSSKNGSIEVGDSLTSSDIPGVAVKAKGSGQIIGTAMEIWDDPNPDNIGSVTMFVKNSYENEQPQFTLTQDNSQDVLAQLEQQQASSSAQPTEISTLSIDQIAANIQIVSPKITVDELYAKRIVAGQIDGLDVITDRLTALENKVATLSAALTTTPAPQSTDSALLDKENELIDKISQNLQSATKSATEPQATLSLGSLNSLGLTTLPGSLHVQGNGLFEGILTVLDTLTTNNFIVNGASTFFSDALFKGNVNFEKSPTFSSDTGGFATIVKGTNRVEVQFDNQFENDPVVNAQVSFDEKQDNQGNIIPTNDIEKSYFAQGYKFIIVNRSKKGFTIALNKNAADDVNFTWTAIQVKDAKNIQSRLPE